MSETDLMTVTALLLGALLGWAFGVLGAMSNGSDDYARGFMDGYDLRDRRRKR